jgi:selenocysteine lyase/cysteine desulfurase
MNPAQTATASPVLDTEAVRRRFPALERTVGSKQVAYFDGPGGTQVPRSVVEAMSDYLYHHNANTHWNYPSSEETDAMIAAARQAAADFLGAGAGDVAFGANMTTLTFHLARALGRGWGPGDEIVVTELDHHANIAPWQALQRDRGVTLRTAPMIAETGQLDWTALEGLVTRKTRLLAVGAASNALGTISDVSRAAELVHAAGGLCFVDAVHYAPHALVDGLIEALDVPKLVPAPEAAPERLETGTLNHEGIAGAAAAIGFLESLAGGRSRRERLSVAYDELHHRGRLLLERLWLGLAEVPGVRLYGPEPSAPRTPTVAFTVRGHASDEIARALGREGLFVSNGDFYASTVVTRLGVGGGGLLRAGCACYTTAEEVDRLVEAVGRLAG